jgi:hypothetical protein
VPGRLGRQPHDEHQPPRLVIRCHASEGTTRYSQSAVPWIAVDGWHGWGALKDSGQPG